MFKLIRVLVLCVWSCVFNTQATNIIFGSKSSIIQIDAGANFINESAISNVDGMIVKDLNAKLEGAEITFDKGSFVDGVNKMKMTGVLDLSNDCNVLLDGDKVFTGKNGSFAKQIRVHGKNNRIEGGLTISNDIVFEDSSSTASVDLIANLKGNIYLNGGSLFMVENNLRLDDHKKIVGPGKVFINGNKLIFGSKSLAFDTPINFIDAADILFNDNICLTSCLTFSGASILEGNFCILDLSGSGKIIVESGSSVLFKNLILYGLHDGAIFCMDNTSSITFQNVYVYMDSDYTFSIGCFDVLNKVKIHGGYKFIYNSTLQSRILSKSTLVLDYGVTFSYDPGNARKDLLAFEDASSTLRLSGATIHATLTGIILTKGTLAITQNSYISSELSSDIDEGITLGNDSEADDFTIKFLRGSKLKLLSGSLKYRNIKSSSWFMENYLSSLDISANSALYLYQNLNSGVGSVDYKGRGYLYHLADKMLSGSVNVCGKVDNLELAS